MSRDYPTHPTYALRNGLRIKHSSRDVAVSSGRAGRKCCAHLNIDFLLMPLLGFFCACSYCGLRCPCSVELGCVMKNIK